MFGSIDRTVDNHVIDGKHVAIGGTECSSGDCPSKQDRLESDQNAQDFNSMPINGSFKGTVTDVLPNKQLIVDHKNVFNYDICLIIDISVGDLVNVSIDSQNKVIVEPQNESLINSKIVEEESNRFIISGQCGQAYIRKTSLTVDYKVGDVLKCCVIETSADHPYTWRAHTSELIEANDNIRNDVKGVGNPSPMMAEKLFDVNKLGLKQFDYDYELVHEDIPSTLSGIHCTPLALYDIPEHLWDVMSYKRNGWQLRKHFEEYKQLLNETNYAKKFHTLLWMEELHRTVDLSRCYMEKIKVKIDGNLFAIDVPGVGEGRPNLILGDRVLIFKYKKKKKVVSKRNKNKRRVFEGYINEIDRINGQILVSFGQQFRNQFNKIRKYILIFQLDRMVYRRQHLALDGMSKKSAQVLFPTDVKPKNPIKKILMKRIKWFNQSLNEQQKLAVYGSLRAECRPTPYIIFGPPGTGKTVTVIESILQVFHNLPDSRIIACSATNNSADLIAQKLLDSQKITDKDLVRVSAFHRINLIPESLLSVTRVADDDYEEWLNFRIIVTTITDAGVVYNYSSFIDENHFTHAFIDEATQVMEPETLIPIALSAIGNGVVVLAGDYNQLEPFVHSYKAKVGGLQQSLMERLMNNFEVYERNKSYERFGYYNPEFVVKLVCNYRSDPQIMTLPSKWYYDNELTFNSEKDRKLLQSLKLSSAFVFHKVYGETKRDTGCISWFNPSEIAEVCAYLQRLYRAGVSHQDIGIITPYPKQVSKIKDYIQSQCLDECCVGTVENFQGLEKRVIIVSLVRSISGPFTYDTNRLNVVISRAKSLLIIIGNPKNLRFVQYWSQFVDYCYEHKCKYRSKPKQSIARPDEKLRKKTNKFD